MGQLLEYGIFGTCADGQLEGRHIKTYAVNANSVIDWGMPVGVSISGITSDVIRTSVDKNVIPKGISCPSVCRLLGANNVVVSMNVFLSRNKQAVAVQTNDTTVTLGDVVCIGADGMLTTTATSGWKMGIVSSLIATNFLDINGMVGKNGFYLELCDVEWVGIL